MVLLLAVLAVLLSSALCSGTEAALFSVSVVKVRQLAESKSRAALALLDIRENMKRPIAAIVILNNIANIVGSIVVGGLAAQVFDSRWMGVFSAGLTFSVIIFSEIIPKTLGERHNERVALLCARPVLGIAWLLTPVIWCIEKLTYPVTGGESVGLTTNEAEIRLLARIGRKEGVIDPRASELIQHAFELDDRTAHQLMTPRVAMTFLDATARLTDVAEKIAESQHSRIVVIDGMPDDVVGIALKAELLAAIVRGQGERKLAELMHEASFVDETTKADRLLLSFQETRQHLAVVRDEFSGVSGVVTLEDVLEVLTGEIVDETDRAVNLRVEARKRPRQE